MANLRYSKDPEIEHSLRSSVRDGIGYSIMTGTSEIYFSAYALFLRATTPQIAFLAAVPPVLGSLATLFSAWIVRSLLRRKPIIMTGVTLQLLTLPPMIWLPYFFPQHAVSILIVFVVLYYAAFHLASPIWTSLMGDLVPERRRGRYFARRTRWMSLTNFVALSVGGVILHFWEMQAQTRLGFLIIFTVAMLARCYSLRQISQMIEPSSITMLPEAIPTRIFLQRLKSSDFARFSLFYASLNVAVTLMSPFIIVYLLRDLEFTYLQFTASTALYVLAQFLTLNMWGRVSDAFGNRLILVTAGSTIAFLPLLWLISSNFWYILGLQIIAGLTWAGFSLSANNFVYDTVSPANRATYMALHNILASVGIFVGSLLGGYLSLHVTDHVRLFGLTISWPSSLCWLFLASAAARSAVALAFIPHLREVRRVARMSAGGLIFRVTQFHALSGFIFSVFPFGQRENNETEDRQPVSQEGHATDVHPQP